MSSAIPVQPVPAAGGYKGETSTFGDISSLYRFFMTKSIRASLSSPPLAKDVGELEFVFDKSALRLYTKVDGTLRYVQFT